MKKLIAVALLSLGGLGLYSQPAAAWFCCHHGCATKCCTTLCLKPYNAFSPICCGNLTCNGCCPLTFGGCQWGYGGMNGPGGYGPFFGNGNFPVGQLPAADPSGMPIFNAPMPTPVNPSGPTSFAPTMPMWPNVLTSPAMPTAAQQPTYYGGYHPASPSATPPRELLNAFSPADGR